MRLRFLTTITDLVPVVVTTWKQSMNRGSSLLSVNTIGFPDDDCCSGFHVLLSINAIWSSKGSLISMIIVINKLVGGRISECMINT